MIAGLDSSFDRPTPAQAAAAYAAGVRVWGGYIGTRGGLGLATLWSQADFDVIRNAGMTPIGFCSGWDDPAAVRDLAASWKVLLCVDVENGIRDDGPWVQAWLDASGAGLYGLSSVHSGRHAAFHVIAWYGLTPPACDDPQAIWPSWVARPASPLAWQFCGTHSEFGLSVDRGWYDDWFALAFTSPPLNPSSPPGGARMFDFRPGDANLRTDLVYVDQQGHLKHRWANGGITGILGALAGEENLSAGLQFAPLSAACRWDPRGENLNISAIGLDGVLYGLYKDVAGNGPGWFSATTPRAATSQPGPQGPKGDAGPAGPTGPSAAPHTHPLTGTTGSSV